MVSRGGSPFTFGQLPQAVIEGCFAFILVAVLAVPLIARLHRMLKEIPEENGRVERRLRARVDKVSDDEMLESCITERLERATDLSRPVELQESSFEASVRMKHASNYERRIMKAVESMLEKMPRLESDAAPEMSDTEDVGCIDYPLYRHKLMQEVLKKYYEDLPPGEVVMNYFHLNADEKARSDCHDLDFLGFTVDLNDLANAKKNENLEYIHPLNHFLTRLPRKPETAEKAIETQGTVFWMDSSSRNERNVLTPPGTPRPLTGDSLSDPCSSTYDESWRSRRSNDDKDTKRKWVVLRPESLNRKYCINRRDIFNERWRSRSRHRKFSPTRKQNDGQNIATSAAATLQDDQSRSNFDSKASEELQKVTLLSSSVDQSEKEEQSASNKRSRNTSSSRILRLCSTFRKDQSSDSKKSNEKSPTSNSSRPSTNRRNSRLPLHVNSKKSVVGKTQASTAELICEKADEKQRRESSVSNDTYTCVSSLRSQRPKTSSGVLNRSTSVKRNKDVKTLLNEKKSKDSSDSKGNSNAESKLSGCNKMQRENSKSYKKSETGIKPQSLENIKQTPTPQKFQRPRTTTGIVNAESSKQYDARYSIDSVNLSIESQDKPQVQVTSWYLEYDSNDEMNCKNDETNNKTDEVNVFENHVSETAHSTEFH